MNIGTCDVCEEAPATHEVRLPRPSDPTELCCVMAVCHPCAGMAEAGPTCKTPAEWVTYMDTPEAKARGFMWLT